MARVLRGTVTSDKMDKTVVVTVSRLKEHPIYRKKYTVTAKFKARDEAEQFKTGDEVEISETRPLSKTVRWQVVRKLGKDESQEGKS